MVKTRAERIEPCIPSVFTKQENEVDPAGICHTTVHGSHTGSLSLALCPESQCLQNIF